jgi:predicted ATPase
VFDSFSFSLLLTTCNCFISCSGYAGKDVATRSALLQQLIAEKAPGFRFDAPLLNSYFGLQIAEASAAAHEGDSTSRPPPPPPSLGKSHSGSGSNSALTAASSSASASSSNGQIPLSALDPEQRTERSIRLMVHLFEMLTLEDPLMVIYTHAHWMDELSWRVAAKLADAVPSVLLVMCMRPVKAFTCLYIIVQIE